MRTRPLGILLALITAPALAHVTSSGMDYTRYRDHNGAPCCDHTDCRPADDFVEAPERGQVRLLIDGQWIDVPRTYVLAERSQRRAGALVRRAVLHQLASWLGAAAAVRDPAARRVRALTPAPTFSDLVLDLSTGYLLMSSPSLALKAASREASFGERAGQRGRRSGQPHPGPEAGNRNRPVERREAQRFGGGPRKPPHHRTRAPRDGIRNPVLARRAWAAGVRNAPGARARAP